MSWAKKRIEQYKKGKKSTFFERRVLEHAEPVHAILAVFGVAFIVYGLWLHNWIWIVSGFVLNFLGHIYSWIIN